MAMAGDNTTDRLQRLIDIGTQLGTTLQLPDLLKLIIESAKEMFQAEASSVILVDEESGDLTIDVAAGDKSREVARQRIPAGKGIAGRVVQTGEALVVAAAGNDPHLSRSRPLEMSRRGTPDARLQTWRSCQEHRLRPSRPEDRSGA